MAFQCPWGCGSDVKHNNAWECPKFSQKLLGALQAVGQKMESSEGTD